MKVFVAGAAATFFLAPGAAVLGVATLISPAAAGSGSCMWDGQATGSPRRPAWHRRARCMEGLTQFTSLGFTEPMQSPNANISNPRPPVAASHTRQDKRPRHRLEVAPSTAFLSRNRPLPRCVVGAHPKPSLTWTATSKTHTAHT